MRKFIFVSLLLLLSAPVFSAQQTLNNLETFGVQRAKINENFTELYGWGNHGLVGYLENSSDVIGVFTGTADGTKFLRDDGTLAVPAGSGHADGSNCAAGSYPLGVDASGAAQSCTDATTEIDAAIAAAASNYATAAQGATADTALQPADVDDTPVNGATTDPVSSNWAFDHGAAADPHAGYMLESNIGSGASNYLQLSATPGTPDGTKYLRDDRTWQVVSAGHGDGTNCAAGSYPLGVDGDGNTQGCTDATTEIDSAIAAAASSYATAAQGATADTAVQPGDAGTVFIAPTGSVASATVVATGFDGNLAVTDNTQQEIAQKFDDYLPAYTDLDFTGTTGLSDGVDDVGLPAEFSFLTDWTDLGDALTNIGSTPAFLYIDDDVSQGDTSYTIPPTLIVQMVPGYQFIDSGTGVITFDGQLIAAGDSTIFSGFENNEIKLGDLVPEVYAQWFGLISGDSISDEAAIESLASALTGNQTVLWPKEGVYNTSAGLYMFPKNGIKHYFRGSKVIGDDTSIFNFENSASDSATGQSISLVAGSNVFTIPGGVTVAVGDFVHIYDDTDWTGGEGFYHGVLARVIAISGSTAYMDIPSFYTHTAENIFVYPSFNDLLIDGLVIDQTSDSPDTDHFGLQINRANNVTVQNSTFEGGDYSGKGLSILGNNVTTKNNYINNYFSAGGNGVGGRTGYCEQIDGVNNRIESNLLKDCKHLITNGFRQAHSNNIIVDGNFFYMSDKAGTDIGDAGTYTTSNFATYALDSHENNESTIYVNNYGNISTDNAFLFRGRQVSLINNEIYQRSIGGTQENVRDFLQANAGNPDLIYIDQNKFSSELSGKEFSSQAIETVTKDGDNIYSGLTRNKPGCNAGTRERRWYTTSGAGVIDTYEICRKDAGDNYAWISLLAGGASTPAGSDGEIQYNDSGSLGATNDFSWDNTTKALDISAADLKSFLTGSVDSSGNDYFVVAGKASDGATGIADNRVVFRFEGYGHDGTDEDLGAAVLFRAGEDWSPGNHGTSLVFKTNLDGTTTDVGRLILDSDGTTILSDLTGTYGSGSAHLCITDAGVVFASESACP